jgi:thiopeptide-type bacteriocin biosynthesis protein
MLRRQPLPTQPITLFPYTTPYRTLTLNEVWPAPHEQTIQGPEGKFVNEFIIPFVKSGPRPAPARRPVPVPAGAVRRSFAPGSEWLYAKMYGGSASVDAVLREVVAPLVQEGTSSGVVDQWFFIRYGDPDWHLRLRLHGPPEKLYPKMLPLLTDATAGPLADGRLWKVQLDTYEREVERYGGAEGIIASEAFFQVDSVAVLQICDLLSGDEGQDARWRLGIRGIDEMLEFLGIPPEERLAVLKMFMSGYGEYEASSGLRHALGNKFRREREALESILDRSADAESPLAPALAVLRARAAQMQPVMSRLRELEKGGKLIRSIREMSGSYSHMFVNRLLRSNHRPQEYTLYALLQRVYESRQARAKAASK